MLPKHPPPLSRPATLNRLQALIRERGLSPESGERALQLADWQPDAGDWRHFFELLLLGLGSVLLLAGIIFFFAYNWDALHRFVKLGLLQGLLVAATGLAWWLGPHRLGGKLALLACVVLLGGLLAVFGQVYQTGADSYQLFLNWSLLALGWVALARFAPLWLAWLGLADLSLILYWEQVMFDQGELRLWIALALFNGVALLSWESVAARLEQDQLRERWGQRVIAVGVMVPLTLAMLWLILAQWLGIQARQELVAIPLYLAVLIAGDWYYQYRRRDLFMLALGLLSLLVVVNTWITRVVGINWLAHPIILLFLAGLWVAQTTLVAFWLHRRARDWRL